MGLPVALGIEGKVGGPNGLPFGYRGDRSRPPVMAARHSWTAAASPSVELVSLD